MFHLLSSLRVFTGISGLLFLLVSWILSRQSGPYQLSLVPSASIKASPRSLLLRPLYHAMETRSTVGPHPLWVAIAGYTLLGLALLGWAVFLAGKLVPLAIICLLLYSVYVLFRKNRRA